MIKAVLFDLGGTLHTASNTPERKIWYAERVIRRLEEYGIHIDDTPEDFIRYLTDSAESYKQETQQNLREYPGDVIWSDFYLKKYHIPREAIAPYAEEMSFLYDYERVDVRRRPHLRETMSALKEDGLRLGMISNIISRSVVPHFLAEYGLLDDMECIVTSSEAGIRKPDPEIFRIAERRMHLLPEELAYVGDTISRDVMGVRRAGWRLMIQIRNTGSAFRDKGLEDGPYKPDVMIEDLAEIPAIIRKINAEETKSE